MSVLIDVPAGKIFTIDGPATLRVGPNAYPPKIDDMTPPSVTTLTPDTAATGDPDFELIVVGTGFSADSVIVFAGFDEPTTFNADGTVSTMVKPSLWANPDTVQVAVRNGSVVSAPMDFTFT